MKFKDTKSGKVIEADEKWAKTYLTRSDLVLIEEAPTPAPEEEAEVPTKKSKNKQ